MLWEILREKLWWHVGPQYCVFIGMVIMAFIAPHLPGMFKLPDAYTMFCFISAPAGWYLINRLIYWLVPGISGIFIIRLDVFLLGKLLWFIVVCPIKFFCSMFIAPVGVLSVLALVIVDVIKNVRKRRESEQLYREACKDAEPRIYRVK